MKQDETTNYYIEACNWSYEMYQSQKIWLRRSLVLITFLSILLCLSFGATLLLFPLKEKVPYLYAFDHATGELTKIGQLEKSDLDANWETTRYMLMRYIINYESFDMDDVETNYQLVWSQSDNNVRKSYEMTTQSSNHMSPYQIFGKDKYVTVKIVSINRLNDFTVDVKFEKNIHDRTSGSQKVVPREAIIKWKFDEAETTQKMLDRDPLGFKVTYYQTSQVNLDKTQ